MVLSARVLTRSRKMGFTPVDRCTRRWMQAVGILILVLGAALTAAAASPGASRETARPQVLILIGPQYGLPMLEAITPPLVRTLTDGGISLDNIYVEFLDLHRNADAPHQANLLRLLQYKLSDAPVGLIITINQGAVDFMFREGRNLLPGVPMLIPILENLPDWEGPPRPLLTLVSRLDAEGTLRYALDLFPRTQRVVLLMGRDDHRAPFLEPIHKALEALPRKLDVETTAHLSFDDMLERVATLPPNTIAFYGSCFEDVTGRSFVPAEVAAQIASHTSVPVFAFRDAHIRQGLMGGSVTITAELGRQAGRITLDYLAGRLHLTRPKTVFEVSNVPLFDWQALQRWNANARRLPGNTVFLNRPLTLWDQYKTALITGLVSFTALILLLAALLVENRRMKEAMFHRKQAEEALQQLNLELEARVRQRTRDLEEANQQLKAFSYSVSHDLRAPLRAMTGFSRILMEKYASGLTPDGLKMCVMIHDSANAMGRLFDALLAFSQAGRMAPQTTSVDMTVLVQAVIEELRATEVGHRVDFRVGDLPAVMADPILMRQVWVNLLSNAVKFSSGKAQPLVAVDATPENGEVVYRVQDNGAGFNMQHAHKLFGVFQRLHKAADFEGTGVGMAIAQQIVTRHGGRIWAQAEPERGATFYFSLAA